MDRKSKKNNHSFFTSIIFFGLIATGISFFCCPSLFASTVESARKASITQVSSSEAIEMIAADNIRIVDVREPAEFCGSSGHIPCAVNYPWNSGILQEQYENLPMNEDILVVCGSGMRSPQAANFLNENGFTSIYDLTGGLNSWTGDTTGCEDDSCSEEPAPPVADAGQAQTVTEGSTILLDGTHSADPDGTINKYEWVQTEGESVMLSDINDSKPTFVTPSTGVGGSKLIFELTVTDNDDLTDTAQVGIDILDNQIIGYPDQAITFKSIAGQELGIIAESNAGLIELDTLDMAVIAQNSGKPESMPYGLIDVRIKVGAAENEAAITFYFPEPIPENQGWFQFNSKDNEWIDLEDNVKFSTDRKEVSLNLSDGQSEDEDGTANGFIEISSGPGLKNTTPDDEESSSGGAGSGGCFIQTSSPKSGFASVLTDGFLFLSSFF
ncbi:choice-of-anchor U domain-containing protein [Desulfobacterales bacterium HSG16]|nr:choice-of-anchor U domain-containing protein [Desulfobacterales bacterium HSG16]